MVINIDKNELDIKVGDLDTSVLKWFDTASVSDITNALYHGYRIVSNPNFNKNIDDSEVSNLEREKELLMDELKGYKRSIETIRESTIQEYKLINMERLAEKETRIQELKEDKHFVLNEKSERILELKKSQQLLEEKMVSVENEKTGFQDQLIDLQSILSNSYKKGSFAENKLEELLISNVSNEYIVENIGSKEEHSADIHLKTRESDGVVLLESKFYSNSSKNMITKEVRKFMNDIDSCKARMNVLSAVFVSISCDIPNITNDFECRVEKGIRCYYFANMTDEKCKLLYIVLGIESKLYKERVLLEGSESMNQFLMRHFMDLTSNYRKIEDLTPGYEDIKREVDKQERKYKKKCREIIENIKRVSDNFEKLSEIDSVTRYDVTELLDIDSPHSLNRIEWESYKSELVKLRVENTDLDTTKQELVKLQEVLKVKDASIIELEKKVTAKVAKKPKSKKST